jgi:predicted transcriptional regulator
MSITLHDAWGNAFEICRCCVSHRNRTVDMHLIHTFQAKGRKLLINTYKQNQSIPTMCIFFEDKEKALEAYQEMKKVVYPHAEKSVSAPVGACEAMTYMIASMAVPVAFLGALIMRSC